MTSFSLTQLHSNLTLSPSKSLAMSMTVRSRREAPIAYIPKNTDNLVCSEENHVIMRVVLMDGEADMVNQKMKLILFKPKCSTVGFLYVCGQSQVIRALPQASFSSYNKLDPENNLNII